MTAEKARTPTATAGEERKTEGEERKDGGMQQRMSDAMQRMPLPGVRMPGMPTGLPGRVLWWGGLAALAAFEVVDWPVAVLVGAGEWVAEQYSKAGAQDQRADQWKEASRSPSPN
jgi:hypothetical protein